MARGADAPGRSARAEGQVTAVRVCIDVPDLELGVRFYASLLGLREELRSGGDLVCLTGGPVPVDLLIRAAGTRASPAAPAARSYARHWTPIHLDLVVDDVDAAVERAVSLGATLEIPAADHAYGRLAQIADPFGHGLCLLSLNARGYAAIADPPG